ncbi:MAG: DUF1127 domain-containing protein [Rhodospirillaceae bacterium]|nr:DUF1127 domain-containing protein [Rhodospirillaceae bacterium]
MFMKFITGSKQSALRTENDLSTFVAISAWVIGCHERARQRRDLASLSDSQLKDIGLTRRDAVAEALKPFWRI